MLLWHLHAVADDSSQSMTEEEKKLFQLYGKLPAKKSNPLARMQVGRSSLSLSLPCACCRPLGLSRT